MKIMAPTYYQQEVRLVATVTIDAKQSFIEQNNQRLKLKQN